MQLYSSADDGQYTGEKIPISIDGRDYTAKSGEIIHIHSGESITLMPGQYHKFWAEEGTGKILLGEISTVNDDREDNHFHDYGGRLPDIIEDEKPRHLIFNDYHYLNLTWPGAWTG